MKRWVTALVIAALPGRAAGEGGAEVARSALATGEFIPAHPQDPVHHGRSHVSVYEDAVQLEGDFAVGPGPGYHVYLVPQAEVTPQTDVAGLMFIDLGILRAYRGSQEYPLPAGLRLQDYQSVVIWSEHFATLIAPARLAFVSPPGQ